MVMEGGIKKCNGKIFSQNCNTEISNISKQRLMHIWCKGQAVAYMAKGSHKKKRLFYSQADRKGKGGLYAMPLSD